MADKRIINFDPFCTKGLLERIGEIVLELFTAFTDNEVLGPVFNNPITYKFLMLYQ